MESDITTDSNSEISTDDEDKKFVSQAVAFVVGHARGGFVSLCARVASLLKEQARLKQEIEILHQEVSYLKLADNNKPFKSVFVEKEPRNVNCDNVFRDKDVLSSLKLKSFSDLPYRAIKGCLCKECKKAVSFLKPPLTKGDKVIIRGEISGIVCYVGHVDSLDFPEIFVGIKLKEAIGDSDGRIKEKSYFYVPYGYGLFIPLSHILCVVSY